MYYGLDVHKKEIEVCGLSKDGKDKEVFRFPTTEKDLRKFADRLGPEDKVVLEATFNTWKIYTLLRESPAKIVVANAFMVKAIAYAKVKTDKVDAHTLVQLLRSGFIPEVEMPDEKFWQLRQLMSHRRLLNKQKVSLKNTIHGILNKNLIRCPYDQVFTKKGREWLGSLSLSPIETLMLENSLFLLEQVESYIKEVDMKLLEVGRADRNVKLLLSIPGVDLVSAVGFCSVVGDINRFRTPNQLASYFGLVPRVTQSGEKCYYGRISKAGTTLGRWLAIEAAQAMVQTSSPLVAGYYRIKHKKGHNVAVTALARKLIVIVWHLLKKQEPYRYAPPARTREKLRKLMPQLPPMYRSKVAQMDISKIYEECNLPLPSIPTNGEKRAATNNKRILTRFKKKRCLSLNGPSKTKGISWS
jgi:transposase